MKEALFFVFSMGVALFADLLLGSTKIFNVIPLLSACMACIWFWHLGFGSRIASAFVIGFLMDAIHFSPVGTHLFVLVMLAFVSEWMKFFFSNTGSVMVRGMSIAMLLIFFRVSIIPVASLLSSARIDF